MTEPSDLIQTALELRNKAYAPYSGFTVSAVVECADGSVYHGCNVENASYGLTTCAERNALAAAIADGKREVTRMIVASSNGVTPCGACRQVIWELCGNIPLLLVDETAQVVTVHSSELLPQAFGSDDLQN